MNIILIKPIRKYKCGKNDWITINDCGKIYINNNEEIKFKDENNNSLLITKTSWGYSNSLYNKNNFLCLISGTSWSSAHYIYVNIKKIDLFLLYIRKEDHIVFDIKEKNVRSDYNIKNKSYNIAIKKDEQYTFLDTHNNEYDVACKQWGFYVTPSFQGRCKKFGLRPVLINNSEVKLVDKNQLNDFKKFIRENNLINIEWLDSNKSRLIEKNLFNELLKYS